MLYIRSDSSSGTRQLAFYLIFCLAFDPFTEKIFVSRKATTEKKYHLHNVKIEQLSIQRTTYNYDKDAHLHADEDRQSVKKIFFLLMHVVCILPTNKLTMYS